MSLFVKARAHAEVLDEVASLYLNGLLHALQVLRFHMHHALQGFHITCQRKFDPMFRRDWQIEAQGSQPKDSAAHQCGDLKFGNL